MIAPMAAVSAAAIAAPFAPPLDRDLRYRTVQHRPIRSGGTATVTLDQVLRFTRVGGGLEASLAQVDASVEAPEPARALLMLLFTHYDAVPIRAALDAKGAITGILGGAETWAAVRDAQAAMLARLEADPSRTTADKARAEALSAQTFDLAPEARDARLADSIAAMLPPPLPALAGGETRAFETSLRSPAGTLVMHGSVTLIAATGVALDYAIELRSDPGAIDPAAAARLAGRPATGGGAPALAGAAYVERTRLTIERATGLIVHARTERVMAGADGADSPIETLDQSRLPVS